MDARTRHVAEADGDGELEFYLSPECSPPDSFIHTLGLMLEGTVVRIGAEFLDVDTSAGVLCSALDDGLSDCSGPGCVVGDRVRVVAREQRGRIVDILPRESSFPSWYEASTRVANLDQAVFVFSFFDPTLDRTRLDRSLASAESAGLGVVVVGNKCDQSFRRREVRSTFRSYEGLGYQVIFTSATRGGYTANEQSGLPALRRALAGRISVFAGPCGSGKRSLVEALAPGIGTSEDTGPTLLRIASGYLVEGPWMDDVDDWAVPSPAGLAECFIEFRPFLGRCNAVSCRHLEESGCAISEALRAGLISAHRYMSYRELTSLQ